MYRKLTPSLFLSLAIAISTMAPVAHAQLAIGALADTNGQLGYDDRTNNASSSSDREASATGEERTNATTSENANTDDRNASISDSIDGQLMAEAHRSTVASFVRSLLAVADREGDMGKQVREIAQAQKDSDATTTDAIEKVSSRSSLKTLFFGSDYTNLGILRSEMVETQDHLSQLNTVLASTTDVTDRATLSAQISALSSGRERECGHSRTFRLEESHSGDIR